MTTGIILFAVGAPALAAIGVPLIFEGVNISLCAAQGDYGEAFFRSILVAAGTAGGIKSLVKNSKIAGELTEITSHYSDGVLNAVSKYGNDFNAMRAANYNDDVISNAKRYFTEMDDYVLSHPIKVEDVAKGSTESLIDIDSISPLLKTEPDTAFFWSGRTEGIGGAEIAADIAKGKGGVTLESTIEAKKIYMPEWDFNNPSTMEAWDLASGAYAEQVSGEIRAVVGNNLRPGNIWENIELPRLKKNPNVTKITTIDPKTGLETIIFER